MQDRRLNGFEIARADLAQRRSGDFSVSGSTAARTARADLAADLALMQNAREEAEALLSADPTLAGYPILLDRVQHAVPAEQNDDVQRSEQEEPRFSPVSVCQ